MNRIDFYILKKLILIERYNIGKIYLSKNYEYIKKNILIYLIDKKK